MKHFYLLLFLALCWSAPLTAQCPASNVSLNTQAEVNNFAENYPNCGNLTGNLYIGSPYSSNDITDISGLLGLYTVGGHLSLANSSLTSLAGWDSLQNVGGRLSVFRNHLLTSLDELTNLRVAEDGVSISDNHELQSIDGIQHLPPDNFNGLRIIDNTQLSSCALANVCTFLQECSNIDIRNNATGCEDILAVRASCGIGSTTYELGEPITFSAGTIVNHKLSDDGTRLFVAREIGTGDDYGNYYKSVYINVLEWNGQDWIDLGQSSSINSWTPTSSGSGPYRYSSALHDFSANGTYFASRVSTWDESYLIVDRDQLKSYEWQGDSSWSTVPRPNISRPDYSFALASEGERIAEEYLTATGRPMVWVSQDGQPLGPTIGDPHALFIRSINISRDGSHLAIRFHTIGLGNTLKIYEWTGTQWQVMPSDDPTLSQAVFNTFSPDGNHLICTYADTQRYYSWDGTAWVLEDILQSPVSGTGEWFLSADNQQLYHHTGARRWLWDGQYWQEATNAIFPDCPITAAAAAASTDLNTLAVRINNSTIVVYQQVSESGFRYALAPVCADGAPRTFEQAVTPAGGVFAGLGVSEGPQAGSFTFDPLVAGVGLHEVSYATATDTFYNTVNVVEASLPELNLPDTLRLRTPRLRLIPGMGTPLGGVYADDSGYLVDDGNGQTFHIPEMPPIAPTTITYTVVDENACIATVSKEVVLINESPNEGGLPPNQIAEDLFSPEMTGQYGYSVSLSADGTRMVVGDPEKDQGEVYIYHREEGEWVRRRTLSATFGQGRLGEHVVLSGDGNTLVVSAPRSIIPDLIYSEQYYSAGRFHIYRWNGVSWVSLGQNYSRSFFNGTIDISYDGQLVASSATFGSARVYRDTGSSLDEENIDSNTTAIALSADGQRVALGRSAAQVGGLFSSVFVYEWQNGSWERLGQPLASSAQADRINLSLDFTEDGNRLVIGSPIGDILDAPAYVRVYDWNGIDWVPAGQTLVDSMFTTPVDWDVAISADGNQLIVGAANNDSLGTATGRATFYTWDGTNWQEVADVLPGGDRAQDQFGFSVAASANAEVVAIGATQSENPLSGGYVRTFVPLPMFIDDFSAVCEDAELVTGLGGAFPVGGTYSGPGVTDQGNGETFGFDPMAAGPGTGLITYTIDTLSLSNTIEVFPLPEVSLNLPDTVLLVPGSAYTLPGEGQPTGGIYESDSELLVDNGDGVNLLYTGETTTDTLQTIRYTYTDAQGCTQSTSVERVVLLSPCAPPTNVQVTAVSENPDEVVIRWPITYDDYPLQLEAVAQGTSPTGTATIIDIQSTPYAWTGGLLGAAYDFYLRGTCVNGSYTDWVGPFNTGIVSTNILSDQRLHLELFPNPTRKEVQLLLECAEATPVQLELYDLLGQRLWQSPWLRGPQVRQSLDLSAYPLGTYWLKVFVGDVWLSRRIVKME